MNDEQLREALETLPRQEAAAGFTQRVMARLDEPATTVVAARWPAMAAVALILALTLGLGWQQWQHQRDQRDARARFQLLLAEKHALEEELQSLRRLASEASVVYLGGNEKLDLVLDLARLKNRGGFPAPGDNSVFDRTAFDEAARPANLQPGQRFSTRNAIY